MFESIGNFLDNVWGGLFSFNPLDPWAAGFYFLPLVICAISYIFETISDLAIDARHLKEYNNGDHSYYDPKTTVGLILGRAFLTVLPAVNIFVAIFSRLGQILDWLGKTFNIAIIGKKQSRSFEETQKVKAAKRNAS